MVKYLLLAVKNKLSGRHWVHIRTKIENVKKKSTKSLIMRKRMFTCKFFNQIRATPRIECLWGGRAAIGPVSPRTLQPPGAILSRSRPVACVQARESRPKAARTCVINETNKALDLASLEIR